MFQRTPDRDEVESLLSPHLESAYRFAYQLTRHEADAEDLLQEACHHAVAKFHLFTPGTNFKAWLFRILRNLRIDDLRRRRHQPGIDELGRRFPVQVDADALEAIHRSVLERPGRTVLENEESCHDLFGDEVNRFLAELPDDFRAALLLCDLEGFSYREIGEILGCPIGTVRSRISRARSYLKEKLYDYARGLGYVKRAE
jgi:RNA polymerase sigma-70 factor (ECF subfamily)